MASNEVKQTIELNTELSDTIDELNRVILGKASVITDTLTAILAGGHILLEDVPGVGKTTLARAVARVLGLDFRRIQFTSDLLPSDVVGVYVYRRDDDNFEFRPGPIFANMVLADEVNRTTPKTQSSLLEAMSESQVSLGQETHPLPRPFLVIATQNPQDYHGTYPLPESQLDRFMVRLKLGYADDAAERAILKGARQTNVDELVPRLTPDQVLSLMAQVESIRVDDLALDYLMSIVAETRRSADLILGVSTRGAMALQRAAQARALLLGRQYVTPDDIKHLAIPVLAHRVQSGQAGGRGGDHHEGIIQEILETVHVPI